jgi:hypothetical protein
MKAMLKATLPRRLTRLSGTKALAVLVVGYLVVRQMSCFPVFCTLLPKPSEVGIRVPEPSLGPREDTAGELEGCKRLNALEARLDGMLAGEGASRAQRAQFDTALADYRDKLAAWRKGLRAKPDLGGPRQPRCRTNALGNTAHANGMRLPKEYRKAVLGLYKPEGSTWGQYTDLMMSLAGSLANSEECRDFHMVAQWIWQWCSYGDWYLLRFDSNYKRLMPYIEDGKDYGNPGIKWQYHYGYGWVKEERIMHMTHAQIFLHLGVHQDVSNLVQIVEFGGGTGDMCAATMDLGFSGTYFIYVSSRLVELGRAKLLHAADVCVACAGHGANECLANVLVAIWRARGVPDQGRRQSLGEFWTAVCPGSIGDS